MKTNNTELIIKSLAIDEFEYRRFRRDSAYVWLAKMFNDAGVEDGVALLAMFWKWWNSQWDIRDTEFVRLANLNEINEVLAGSTRLAAIALYNEVQDVYSLKVFPPSFLVEQIDAVIKAELERLENKIKVKK